jgi:hypothetical protein
MTIMTTTVIPCSVKLTAHYRADCGRTVRRNMVGRPQRLLYRDCGDHLFRRYSEKNKNIHRRCRALCHGTSRLSLTDRHQHSAQYVGTRLVVHQKGGNGYPFGDNICLVHFQLWVGEGGFGMVDMEESVLAVFGRAIAPVFTPLGWGR